MDKQQPNIGVGLRPTHYPYLEPRPHTNVSWFEAKRFCTKSGLTLLSEAQWEYACRAGNTGDYSGSGWHSENSYGNMWPVGKKEANEFGIRDMRGNVAEWCEDVYDKDFYKKPESRNRNPVCQSGSNYRVLRGGAFFQDIVTTSSYARLRLEPTENQKCGFRVAFPCKELEVR